MQFLSLAKKIIELDLELDHLLRIEFLHFHLTKLDPHIEKFVPMLGMFNV